MPEVFERIRTAGTSAAQVRKAVASLRQLPEGLELDSARGQSMVLGQRRWTFILTKSAAQHWDALGKEAMPLGVLAFHHPELRETFVERVLVALPAARGTVKLEMRDSEWNLLWTGRGRLIRKELAFSMPISRAGVKSKGMMAGRLNSRGRLTLTAGRLPKPIKKKKAKLASVD